MWRFCYGGQSSHVKGCILTSANKREHPNEKGTAMSDTYNGTPVPPYAEQDDAGNTAHQASTKPNGTKHEKHKKEGKQHSGDRSMLKSVGGGAIGAVIVVALVMMLWSWTPLFNGMKSGTVSSSNGTITITGDDEATTAEAVAAKDIDSVVTIYVYSNTSSDYSQYFNSGNSSSNSPSALGSGVIIKQDGDYYYIVTNYHVVEGASKATVKVGDQQYTAESVGYDSKTDLAVIRIKASGLTVMEWGDSTNLNVGQWVMAIGSPYGYEQTVTTGIVSALYRSDVLSDESGFGTTVYTDMIQTDAAINPGNSGGALVDSEGRLIGINTYISSTSQSSAGLGFAIPSAEVQSVTEQLINGQTVNHAYLGITMSKSNDPAGVKVTSVFKDTAAASAGLQTGDVITKIDGSDVTSTNDVSVAVSKKSAGDTLDITYVRNGQENTTTATLGSDADQSEEYADNGAPSNENYYGGNGSGRGYGNGGSGNGNSGNGGSNSDMLNELFGNMFGYGSGNGSGSNSGSFWNN